MTWFSISHSHWTQGESELWLSMFHYQLPKTLGLLAVSGLTEMFLKSITPQSNGSDDRNLLSCVSATGTKGYPLNSSTTPAPCVRQFSCVSVQLPMASKTFTSQSTDFSHRFSMLLCGNIMLYYIGLKHVRHSCSKCDSLSTCEPFASSLLVVVWRRQRCSHHWRWHSRNEVITA